MSGKIGATQGLPGFDLLELQSIRQQFPGLSRQINGQPAVFFDGPGGTQVSKRVIDAVADYYASKNANSGGPYITSQLTDKLVGEARLAMADLLGCEGEEIIFGANMTSLTFAISRSIGRQLKPGDEIIVTALDHDANVGPWKALEERGAVVHQIAVRKDDCTLDLDDLASKLNKRTALVAIGYASNAVGTINPIKQVVRLAHEVGALVYVDAVHYAPHGPIDVRDLDCDFLACSPYKFFAPHIGCVYGKKQHLTTLRPYKVRPATNESPFCWETGTATFELLAGVVAAIEYFEEIGRSGATKGSSRREILLNAMNKIRQYETALSESLLAGLLKVPGLELYGIKDLNRVQERTPTFGFNIANMSAAKVNEQLAENGIFAWDGNFYAIGLTETLGLEPTGGMVRIGTVHYNTLEEVDRVLKTLTKISAG